MWQQNEARNEGSLSESYQLAAKTKSQLRKYLYYGLKKERITNAQIVELCLKLIEADPRTVAGTFWTPVLEEFLLKEVKSFEECRDAPTPRRIFVEDSSQISLFSGLDTPASQRTPTGYIDNARNVPLLGQSSQPD